MILGLPPTLSNVSEIADTIATPSHALETPIMNDQKLLNCDIELVITGPSYTQRVAEVSPELSRIRFDKELEDESRVYAHDGPSIDEAPQTVEYDADTSRQGSVTHHVQTATDSASNSELTPGLIQLSSNNCLPLPFLKAIPINQNRPPYVMYPNCRKSKAYLRALVYSPMVSMSQKMVTTPLDASKWKGRN
jgi:hypothetical protein